MSGNLANRVKRTGQTWRVDPSGARSVSIEIARVTRELNALATPASGFDPSRYFRSTERMQFLNVRTPIVRALGRHVARAHRDDWSLDDAVAFTGQLLRAPHLELKGCGIEA